MCLKHLSSAVPKSCSMFYMSILRFPFVNVFIVGTSNTYVFKEIPFQSLPFFHNSLPNNKWYVVSLQKNDKFHKEYLHYIILFLSITTGEQIVRV